MRIIIKSLTTTIKKCYFRSPAKVMGYLQEMTKKMTKYMNNLIFDFKALGKRVSILIPKMALDHRSVLQQT